MSLRMETDDGLLALAHRRAIGGKTGLVFEWYVSHRARSDPEAYLTVPDSTDIAGIVGFDGDLDLGVSGKGASLAGSLASALGETIERYCLCWPPDLSSLDLDPYEERVRHHRTIEWSYLDVFSDAQRGSVLDPLNRETPLYWTTGIDLLTGASVSVPAELVWMRVGSLEGVPQHFPGSSNGTAAGTDLEDAIVRAIYEAVERDAFMRTWCLQRSPTQLSIPTGHAARSSYDRVHGRSITPYVFAYESPIDVPTVGAALRNDRERQPNFITGGGAALRPVDAIDDALNEVAQGWPYTTYMATQHDVGQVDARDATDNFDENVLYYSRPENADEVEFLFEGPTVSVDRRYERPESGDQSELETLLSALDRADCTPIAFDLTTPDAAQAGTAVARVVIPELVSLTPPAILPRTHPAFDGRTVTDKPHPYP
ncbi:MAG: YcaO-like family protein [Halobacteriota archaeon]